MVDNLINDYSGDPELLKEFQVKKEQIIEEKERLRAACDPVLSILDRDDVKEVFFYFQSKLTWKCFYSR